MASRDSLRALRLLSHLVDIFAGKDAGKQLSKAAEKVSKMLRRAQHETVAVTIPNLSKLVDFSTQTLDKSKGVIISLNHYWKL